MCTHASKRLMRPPTKARLASVCVDLNSNSEARVEGARAGIFCVKRSCYLNRYNTLPRSKNRVEVVQLNFFAETINRDAHYNTGWSAESATNGVVRGGVFMNMLPKDHIYVL